MNGYSLNRASLNGSVIAFIAGAALISSSGSISATGLRTVNPEVLQIAASGSIAPTGTRVAMGSADAFSNSTISAFPGLLFVSSANFTCQAVLGAQNTESYFQAGGTLQATGTDIQNGSASFVGNSLGSSALPLYIAGTAASFTSVGTMSADASYKPNGSPNNYRDGYVSGVPIGATFTANALRTALCGANAFGPTIFAANGGLIQGGSSQFVSGAIFNATGAADAGWSILTGNLSATGFVTSYPAPIQLGGTLAFSASQNVLTQGTTNPFVGTANLEADDRLAIQSDGPFQSVSTLAATGTIFKMANAVSYANGSLTALGGLLIYDSAVLAGWASFSGNPLVNANSIDPPERTMIRPYIDRVMLRPYVNRVMQREP